MSFIKTFVLGAAVAYGIQYITKKRGDGSSILSDFMDNPPDIVKDVQSYASHAVEDAVSAVKQTISPQQTH